MTFIKKTQLQNFLNTPWYAYARKRTGVDMPNCFTYACGRISEIIGKEQPLDAVRVRGAGDLWEGHAPQFEQQSSPQAGALMIWKGGNGNYGHVAVCEGVINANLIEWSESNYGGSMFCFVRRDPKGYANLQFMGYLIHKDLKQTSQKVENSAILNTIPSDFVYEKATFYCDVDKINIRRAPSLQGEQTGDWYEKGMHVYYDGYVKREGYVWISWISGKTKHRHWMAVGELDANGINTHPYGTFR